MEQKVTLVLLLVTGIIACIVGFALGQFLVVLTLVVFIAGAFFYSDLRGSDKTGRKDLRKNVACVIFVIVTIYCIISGLWIFWAGITAMLYIDTLTDSIMERLDAHRETDPGIPDPTPTGE